MVIACSLPVPLSLAVTLIIPLASISKVTSICGIPLGAGGIPTSWKRPSELFENQRFGAEFQPLLYFTEKQSYCQEKSSRFFDLFKLQNHYNIKYDVCEMD